MLRSRPIRQASNLVLLHVEASYHHRLNRLVHGDHMPALNVDPIFSVVRIVRLNRNYFPIWIDVFRHVLLLR